jgi:hypothetical protein
LKPAPPLSAAPRLSCAVLIRISVSAGRLSLPEPAARESSRFPLDMRMRQIFVPSLRRLWLSLVL